MKIFITLILVILPIMSFAGITGDQFVEGKVKSFDSKNVVLVMKNNHLLTVTRADLIDASDLKTDKVVKVRVKGSESKK